MKHIYAKANRLREWVWDRTSTTTRGVDEGGAGSMDKIEYWKEVWLWDRDTEYYCALPDDTFMYFHPHSARGWHHPVASRSWKNRKIYFSNIQRVERLEIIVVCGCLCPLDKGENSEAV